MKLLQKVPAGLLAILLFLLTTASTCTSDDDSIKTSNDNSVATVKTAVAQTTWKVANYTEKGVDKTARFSGYTFTFGPNGALSATSGTTTLTGTWASGTDDSTPKFILKFNVTSGPFEEISEDWKIVKASETSIELKNVSGGNGTTDLLTFAKVENTVGISNDNSVGEVKQPVQPPAATTTWKVANYTEKGVDKTARFSGYTFTFGPNGALSATSGTTTLTGTWASGTDDSTPKFILKFNVTSGPFEEISEDWKIVKASETSIELKNVSGGNGTTDLLTFSKI
jgi:ribosome-associated toxin RatA of RatAB toxin-antitoxin module